MSHISDPSVFASSKLVRRLYTIYGAVCLGFLVVGVPFVFHRKLASALFLGGVLAVLGIAWRFNRHGRPQASLKIFASFMWIILVALIFGGLPPITSACALGIAELLAVVVSVRVGAAYGVTYMLAWLIYIGLSSWGMLPAPYFLGSPITSWFIGLFAVWVVLLPIPELVAQIGRALSLQRATLAATPDGVLAADLDGRIETYNSSLLAVLGVTDHADRLRGVASLIDILRSKGAKTEPVTRWFELVQSGDFSDARMDLELSPERHLEIHATPRLQDGTMQGIVLTIRDISDRILSERTLARHSEQLESTVTERTAALSQAERRLRVILNGIPGVVGYWDRELVNRFANSAYHDWLGLDPDEIVGRTYESVFGRDMLERNRPLIEGVLQGTPQHFERGYPYHGDPEQQRYAQVHFIPDQEGDQVKGFFVMAFDIDALKRSLESAVTANKLAHVSLLESSLQLNIALEAADLLAWHWDVHTGTTSWSSDPKALLGPKPEGGYPDFKELVDRRDLENFLHIGRDALAGTGQYHVQFRLRRTDDDLRWVSARGSVLRGADGKALAISGVSQDITERKQNETELAAYRKSLEDLVAERTRQFVAAEDRASHILQSTADGLYGVDLAGRITFINPAACRMLGLTATESLGKDAHQLFHHALEDGTPYPAEDCPVQSALRLGMDVRVDDEVFWHADGHPIPVMYAIHPLVQDSATIGAVTSFVDMTEQRAAAIAQQQALQAAESLARVRREFLANMSHEIRTPLNGVIGFAEIGYRSHADSEKSRNAFEKIKKAGTQLLGVVNDILDFSSIEAGKLLINNSRYSIRELVENALGVVRDRLEAKSLTCKVMFDESLPEFAKGDPLRIGQVLINLLANAVKFTEQGGIALSVTRGDQRLFFKVADTGIGIDAKQIGMLFNPFSQLDGSSTRPFGGTGLGLSISKRILELVGGGIHVDSHIGIGSVFEFWVPSGGEVDGSALETSGTNDLLAGALTLNGLSILCAEDDKLNQSLLMEYLESSGAKVILADDGQQAVDVVHKLGPGAFDIVLMDIQMPKLDGYLAARAISEIDPNLPIVGQTAHAFGEERDRCLAEGMVAHIGKPIDHDELIRVVLAKARKPTATLRAKP